MKKYTPLHERGQTAIGTMRFVSIAAATRILPPAALKHAEIGPPEVNKNESVFVENGRFFVLTGGGK